MINLTQLDKYPLVSVDLETTGLHWYRDKIFGVAMSVYDGEQFHSDYWDIRTNTHIMRALKDALPTVRKLINHNIKFDANFLLAAGIPVPLDQIECTSVRAALINEHEPSFSLDSLSKKYLKTGKVDVYRELADLFGGEPTREAQIKNLHRAPESLARKYAVVDPELALRLWTLQEKEIERQGLGQVWELERKLTPILVQIEQQGVRVDGKRAERSIEEVDVIIEKAQAGVPINANSPKQVCEFFKVVKREANNPRGFNYYTDTGMKLPVTDTNQPSMGKDVLVIMAEQGDTRARNILRLRKMTKAKSFLNDHILGHEVGGRVYPNYNQTRGDNDLGTGTGRFSINDPALQQIPARDADVAEIVRSCFIPEEGHQWCCADWAQFEFRWFAHYTKDPAVMKAYADDPDTDYHQIVSDLTGIPRKPRFAGDANAKQINLGLVFGMGKGKMAYEMGMDYEIRHGNDGREWYVAGPKAEAVFNTYHGAIPGVSQLLAQASSIAKTRGYVQTIAGRHIRFPGGMYTHKAGGLVFQGTSADCMKQKMIELWPICKDNGSMMLLSVHDELDFSMPKGKAKKQSIEVKRVLETFDGVKCPIACRVPIRSSVELGSNWYEASK
jgi:DNA polymerase I-like protein with 3'-5' exonuclease and polymerase domains